MRVSHVVVAGCIVFLALALVVLLRDRKAASMDSKEALAAISALHGVSWPSNAMTTHFTIWRYRAAQDGSSQTTETLAKLETDDDSFANWYSNATNVLSELKQPSVPNDARLSGKAGWWVPHELSGAEVVLLSHDLDQPTGISSKLRLFIGATETNRVIYLHCHVRQR